ncbi:SDR family oxidoreductase [Euryarchaeota archaeon]|mgnify:FL=1|jgi:NAD(P)-dependent dehydrogenase (short-subunit alcohol dehydrogenase family)|nr:SDR family oxidoreductase [Euryarchaeota archaeon]|tara:strand:+ start:18397 stop:19158 length:762 start_codon:yes stop_codon:yes gene_type:complete
MGRGTVLITGASKRIGRAISLMLASEGYSIAIHYNNSHQAALELSNKINCEGGNSEIFHADLSNSDSASNLINDVESSLGRISGLVNNASMFIYDDISNLTSNLWDSHMNINAKAPALLIKELSKATQNDKRASVVNILDQKIANPSADHISYTASRYALLGLTDALARGLAPNIRINAVAPGHTMPSEDQSTIGFNKAQNESPLGFGPSPSDIAQAVSFLISARAITGQIIYVDCGERFLSRKRDVLFETED